MRGTIVTVTVTYSVQTENGETTDMSVHEYRQRGRQFLHVIAR